MTVVCSALLRVAVHCSQFRLVVNHYRLTTSPCGPQQANKKYFVVQDSRQFAVPTRNSDTPLRAEDVPPLPTSRLPRKKKSHNIITAEVCHTACVQNN